MRPMSNLLNLLAVLLTAAATALGAYAAIRANESAENIAALQAIAQFNTAINKYSRSGACSDTVMSGYDRGRLSSLLDKAQFSFGANDQNYLVASRCLEKSIRAGDQVTVSAEESNNIYQEVFNAFNGYEAILLYWSMYKGNRGLICLEVFPSFDRYVRPLLTEMTQLTMSDEAKRLIAGFPALIAFSQVKGCGAAA